MPKLKKVCVIGLGQVGLPTALYIKERAFEVWGFDVNEMAVKRAQTRGIKASTDLYKIPSADVYVICVSTGLKNGKPDMSSVYDACGKIAEKGMPYLISIESTVIPGTCSKVYSKFFNESVKLIHVPHRYWTQDPERHGVRQTRVIGAINEESLEVGLEFYGKKLNIPLYPVSSIEVAEMCKIAENAYRYVQIAFAEELRMICDELGLDFDEVRNACNTKWNIEILEARDGIKGHCLPKDIKYLAFLTRVNNLLKGAINADKEYQLWFMNKEKQKTK